MSSAIKLYVSTPCYGGVCLKQYADSLLKLQQACIDSGIRILFDTIENESLVHRARNCAVGRFMQCHEDYTHFMFIDAEEKRSIL